MLSCVETGAVVIGADFGSVLGWEKAVLPPSATLREAINNLNSTAMQIVLVVDSSGLLSGVVTDGDIRRCLLTCTELDQPVSAAVETHPIAVGPETDRVTAVALLRTKRLRHLPVVDHDGRLVGLHGLDELVRAPEVPNLMVLMAGGEGQRLRPYTESCPKPMLPVGGRPILEHILERAIAQGFRKFVFTIHYLADLVVDHFKGGEKWGVQIEYLYEDRLLGTAGGLAFFDPMPTSTFVVSNGDVLTNVDHLSLLDFHHQHEALCTMAVRVHEWQNPFGVVRTKGVEIIGFEEKPQQRTYVNAGVYVIESGTLGLLNGEPCDMPEFFNRVRNSGGKTIVFPVHEEWIDIGREIDYLSVRDRIPNTD